MMMRALIPCLLALMTALPAAADERGPETGLPMPRYVSLKNEEANVRRGPSRNHRIDWIYQRRGLPVRVTAEYGHWRRIEDRDGVGGWVHYALLSGSRTAIVDRDGMMLTSRPDGAAAEVAQLSEGVIVRVLRCDGSWCRLRVDGHRGWVRQEGLWGIVAGEVID